MTRFTMTLQEPCLTAHYSKQANERLDKEYAMGATHIIIAPSDMSKADSISMINDIKEGRWSKACGIT